MPSVAPCTSAPMSWLQYTPVHLPARTKRSLSGKRRATPSMRAQAMSAVVSVSTPGVFVTKIPRRVAAATSTML